MKKNDTVLYVCATIIALALIAGFVVLVLLAPKGTDLVSIFGACFTGILAVATALGLTKTNRTASKVDELSNGLMDAKVRAGLADVLPDHLIDPAATPQIEADRARRAGI